MQRFRADTLFQHSNLAAAIDTAMLTDADGRRNRLFGSIMAFPHHKVARTVSVLGLDFVMIDALQTAIGADDLYALIQTINFTSEGRTCTIVRVPSVSSHLLTYALDAGASGIVFPHIDTADEAEEKVKKVRYEYSKEARSLAPCALLGGITDFAGPGWTAEKIADRNIVIICQIESTVLRNWRATRLTREIVSIWAAVENVNDIASVEGVQALRLGAGDLRVSLRLPARTPPGSPEHPRFFAAVDKLFEAAEAHGKALMTVAFKSNTNEAQWLGHFTLLVTSADIVSVVRGHKENLARIKAMVAEP